MAKTNWRKGTPLDGATQTRLRDLIQKLGVEGAAEALGVSVGALTGAASGAGIRRVTTTAITERLGRLNREKAAGTK